MCRAWRWDARALVEARGGRRGEGWREGWVVARARRRGCGAGEEERRGWSWVVLLVRGSVFFVCYGDGDGGL